MISINFSRIKNSPEPSTHIEEKVEMRPEFIERSKKFIYQVKRVHLIGDLFYNVPYVTGDFYVKTELVVPSSRSLTPVDFKEDFHFSENYTEQDISKEEIEESDIPVVKIENDIIDLQTAVEDNLLLHIPTTILTPDEQEKNIFPKGKGWAVISENEFKEDKKSQVNPAFAKLKELLEQKNNDNNSKKD